MFAEVVKVNICQVEKKCIAKCQRYRKSFIKLTEKFSSFTTFSKIVFQNFNFTTLRTEKSTSYPEKMMALFFPMTQTRNGIPGRYYVNFCFLKCSLAFCCFLPHWRMNHLKIGKSTYNKFF